MGDLVAAIDQGTTSTRCIIFSRNGEIVGEAHKEHRQYTTRDGWVEHDAVEILRSAEQVAVGALNDAGVPASRIAGIGITNQRETTVVWSRRTGQPLARAIVWMDSRAQPICDRIAKRLGGRDALVRQTGLPLASYFSAGKLRWLLENVAGLEEAAQSGDALFGTIDTWLLWNLTGGCRTGIHVTDVTNASRTMLMDLETLDWSDSLCRTFDVPRQMLPEIRSSSEVYGHWDGGPLDGVPLAGVLGDQQAALFGQVCFQPGSAKNTYGTGCFLLMNTGTEPVYSSHGLLTTVAYQRHGEKAHYGLEGSVAQAGSVIGWVKNTLGLIRRSGEIEGLAREASDNGGVYFVPAFSGLLAPYWRSDARGTLIGLTQGTQRGHIARAALEAAAFQTCDLLTAMRADRGFDETLALKVDGGMVVNDLLLQSQADLMGAPVVRPQITETTALGAAFAAGLAVGVWGNTDELRALWKEDRVFQPAMDAATRRREIRHWHRAVDRSIGWLEGDEKAETVDAAGDKAAALGTGESEVAGGEGSASATHKAILVGIVVGAFALVAAGWGLFGRQPPTRHRRR